MYDLNGRVRQTKAGLYVHLSALLANSCMEAEIYGTYPGNIVHIVDPGHAEIFITERLRPGSGFCLQHLVPWYAQRLIVDYQHSQVAVLVNGKRELMLRVQEPVLESADEKTWVVTALVGAPKDGPFCDCAVHHQDDIVLGIYARVFGPDTRADCEAFKAKSCEGLRLKATG